jgi:hypothetical protein
MSLINTRIQNARANGNLDKYELRPSRYGALNLFMSQTEDPAGLITEELKAKAEKSIGSTLETPVIEFDAGVTIGDTRSVVIADSENTSDMYQITFTTYSWGFTSVPSLFLNNEVSMQKDFERKFKKYLYKFGEVLDAAAVAALASAKTQVFADLLNYTETGFAVIAPWKSRENVIGDINPMMAANDYFSDIHVLGNAGVESIIRKLAQKDLYNVENKTLEYSDKILHFSTRVSNDVGEFANMYAVNGGSLGILTRFDREAILGTSMADGTEWGIETLPLLNFPVGTYYYESKGDYSAIAGAASADMTAVRKEHYGFSVDVAFITPLMGAAATPIMKLTISSEDVTDAMDIRIVNSEADPVNTKEVV